MKVYVSSLMPTLFDEAAHDHDVPRNPYYVRFLQSGRPGEAVLVSSEGRGDFDQSRVKRKFSPSRRVDVVLRETPATQIALGHLTAC